MATWVGITQIWLTPLSSFTMKFQVGSPWCNNLDKGLSHVGLCRVIVKISCQKYFYRIANIGEEYVFDDNNIQDVGLAEVFCTLWVLFGFTYTFWRWMTAVNASSKVDDNDDIDDGNKDDIVCK